ncbi:MAG: hypothetical protein IPP36_02715 [Nitrosomonadales bacterium]|nr:hypothetical protein [Nitrosomonadales bacterium]
MRKTILRDSGVLNHWPQLAGQPIEEPPPFKALDDINFFVEQGEVSFGIIGINYAGKSNENCCLTPLICFHHLDAPSRN